MKDSAWQQSGHGASTKGSDPPSTYIALIPVISVGAQRRPQFDGRVQQRRIYLRPTNKDAPIAVSTFHSGAHKQ